MPSVEVSVRPLGGTVRLMQYGGQITTLHCFSALEGIRVANGVCHGTDELSQTVSLREITDSATG
jgi:hypothetical protein